MKTKVIYIASLDHSGSTMLDKMIGSHTNLISLGETNLIFKKYLRGDRTVQELQCTCGKAGEDCEFWSPVFQQWDARKVSSYSDAYNDILQVFNTQYPNHSIVDSSKYIFALKILLNNQNVELKVVHLMKDVRAFLISRTDKKSKEGKISLVKKIKWMRTWLSFNQRLVQLIKEKGLNSMKVGYEEVCIDTENMMQLISDFIEVSFEEAMLDAANNTCHQLDGNIMRFQKSKNKISYDTRWMQRTDWMIPYVLNPKVLKYNHTNVYSNRIDKKFKRT